MHTMSEKKIVPIMENMWTTSGNETHLIATQCEACGEVFFPRKQTGFCSHCYSDKLKDIELSSIGTVKSYTSVVYPPAGGFYKGPVPFNYIIAEFPEGVFVQGHYIGVEADQIHVGDKVRTVVDVLQETDDEIMMSYKFAPADEEVSK